MTTSLAALSMFASNPATYLLNTKQPANASLQNPLAIGNLEQEGTSIAVTGGGTNGDGVQTYNFTLKQGDQATLGVSFNNPVDTMITHVQLYDSQGNLVADNQGTTQQQAQYTQLTGGGLAPGAGNYSLKVTPVGGAGAPQIAINAVQQQGTALSVTSQLTPGDQTEYYDFSLYDSKNMKLAFNPASSTPPARVQLFDNTGHLIADNRGTVSQQQNYVTLTSGTGLTRNPGTYTVGVTYANQSDADNGASLKYNLQLFSGNSYSVLYQTNVAATPGDTSAAGSVKPTDDAQLYTKQSYHTVNETGPSGVPIGYLAQNKTSLDVTSLLTSVDSTDYYSFVLQGTSNNLKLALTNQTNASDTTSIHLQVLNAGGQVIADNQGTSAQKSAYAEITSSKGLTGQPGTYYVKATYAAGANKSQQIAYNFQLFSGTTYTASYRTLASAQTYENALLSGDIGSGFNGASATASYISGGFSTDIFGSSNLLA